MKTRQPKLDKTTLFEQIRNDNNLLSLPQVLSAVLKEAASEDFSPDRLAHIIMKDPSLTSRVLTLSNSPFYRRFAEINTVNQAVSILGATTVKCMALSSSIFHPEKIAVESGVDPRTFLTTSLATAAASEKIAAAIDYEAPEEAFIAGLLLDLGTIYMLHHHPHAYKEVTLMAHLSNVTLIDVEKDVFGADHTEIGTEIARSLGLPEYVVSVIDGHHDMSALESLDALQLVGRLATLLAGEKYSGFEMPLEERLQTIGRVTEVIGLTKEIIDGISFSLLPETVAAAEYIGIDIGDVEQLLITANQEIWKTYLVVENLFKERQELSKNLLKQERLRGALEAKNVAMATLSHYLNNATMAIYGRSELMRMHLRKNDTERLLGTMPDILKSIDGAVKKIVAVLEEMKEITPIDHEAFSATTKSLDIDERLAKRIEGMSHESRWDAQIEIHDMSEEPAS